MANIVEEFITARRYCCVNRMADLWLKIGDKLLGEMTKQPKIAAEYEPMLASADALLAAVLENLRPGRYEYGIKCLALWEKILSMTGLTWWRECAKYAGILQYGLGNFDAAAKILTDYLQYQPQDEYGHFYLANSLFRQNKIDESAVIYERLLHIDAGLSAAMTNFGLVLAARQKRQAQGREAELLAEINPAAWLIDYLPPRPLPHISADECRRLPIFINSRDRVGCLRRLIAWLTDNGYQNIFVVDNSSTYPPLLNYYQDLEARGIRVLRLDRNVGHKALWLSRILQRLGIESPYVYTDSDVMPTENCPADVVVKLYDILSRYPYLDKVGLGIVVDKLTAPNAENIKIAQGKFYHVPLEENVYFHPHDTTFALYRPNKAYRLCAAARTLGNLQVYHLPWHYNYGNLPPDEIYYMEHANESSNQARDYQKYL